MEVPPGRLEASKVGGRAALMSLLSEADRRKLNGLLVIRRLRDDIPVEGVIVFNRGSGTLASHSGREIAEGPRALKAILRDALSEDASLELRSYDYRGSTIRIEQLASTHPDARIDAMPDLPALVAQVEAEEAEGSSRIPLVIGGPELHGIHDDLRSVQEGSVALHGRLHGDGGSENPPRVQDHRIATLELERARAEARAVTTDIESKRVRLSEDIGKLEAQRSALEARAKEVETAQRGLTEERKRLKELFASVQSEMDKIVAARRELIVAGDAVTAREKDIIHREAALATRETRLKEKETAVLARHEDTERREAELHTKTEGRRETARAAERAQRAPPS